MSFVLQSEFNIPTTGIPKLCASLTAISSCFASTTKIARNKNAQGFEENKDAAKRGGTVAGVARKELEKESSEKVVSKENYIHLTEKKRKLIEEKE